MVDIRKLFGFSPRGVADDWNTIGRAVAAHDGREIADLHEGRSKSPTMMEDRRTPEMGDAVLREVIAMNRDGSIGEIREKYDPAYTPLLHQIKENKFGLQSCAIIGPNEFLVNKAAPFPERYKIYHLVGDTITEVSSVMMFAWSRNRRFFLTAHKDGSLSVGAGFNDPDAITVRAPRDEECIPRDIPEKYARVYEHGETEYGLHYSHIAISDDGAKILLCDGSRGALLGVRSEEETRYILLHPSMPLDLGEMLEICEKENDAYTPGFDMLHGALAPDGRLAAIGDQGAGHWIIALEDDVGFRLRNLVWPISEYPHDGCFSDDSRHVAFNACHFYNGATGVIDLATTPDTGGGIDNGREFDATLNDYLRVYASAFVPGAMNMDGRDGFLLVGSGYALCAAVTGETIWELFFGSSGAGVDVCPTTGRVLISSYSGMLHLIDPRQIEDPPLAPGYRTPRELRRWIFWDQLEQPLIW